MADMATEFQVVEEALFRGENEFHHLVGLMF
jgi:hypothetical protein